MRIAELILNYIIDDAKNNKDELDQALKAASYTDEDNKDIFYHITVAIIEDIEQTYKIKVSKLNDVKSDWFLYVIDNEGNLDNLVLNELY